MIASDDVRRVTFERIMRGYRCEDVDDYLKQVADAMDALSQENEDLQNKIRILGQRIDQYRSEEDTLRTTMINAQRMGENVIKEAKQKAAETIRAANIKADDREQRARDEVELAQQEIITLKHEANSFKKMLLDKYRVHVEMLSKLPEYEENAEIVEQQESGGDYPEYTEPVSAPEVEQPTSLSTPMVPEAAEVMPESVETAIEETPPVDEEPQEVGVDTVEFAIAPKRAVDDEEQTDAPVDDQQDDLSREQQVSALFAGGSAGLGVPASSEKIKGKPAPKPRAKANTKTSVKKPQDESLPAAFDSFEGVDFDS